MLPTEQRVHEAAELALFATVRCKRMLRRGHGGGRVPIDQDRRDARGADTTINTHTTATRGSTSSGRHSREIATAIGTTARGQLGGTGSEVQHFEMVRSKREQAKHSDR